MAGVATLTTGVKALMSLLPKKNRGHQPPYSL
uniref:Uncharacterized protein n=1 Tax=Anguilla anguilla TaxID=7936 RepID=A0A0E9XZL0_ANGAN